MLQLSFRKGCGEWGASTKKLWQPALKSSEQKKCSRPGKQPSGTSSIDVAEMLENSQSAKSPLRNVFPPSSGIVGKLDRTWGGLAFKSGPE